MKNQESISAILLLDIIRGYSKLTYKNNTYYFKHFQVFKSLENAEFELDSFNSAVKRGIKTEDQLIELAIKRKSWSEKEEGEIKNLKWMIQKSEKAVLKISDPTSKRAFEKSIEAQKQELEELESKRFSVVSHSAERFAEKRRLYSEASQNVFRDEAMEDPLDQDDLFEVFPVISQKIEELNNSKNLLHAAYSPSFFDIYTIMYRSPHEIFKMNIFNVTIWQKKILFYASVLLNKLKNYDMPDEVREDPVRLFEYRPQEDGSPQNKNVVHGVDDLRRKMAQKGGKLSAEDF